MPVPLLAARPRGCSLRGHVRYVPSACCSCSWIRCCRPLPRRRCQGLQRRFFLLQWNRIRKNMYGIRKEIFIMNNELKPILARVDHTLLSQTATWDQIRAICDDGVKYGCASVCIPASYVKQAAEYVRARSPCAPSSASPMATTPPPPSASRPPTP